MKLHSGQNDSVLEWLSRRVDFALPPQAILFWATSDVGVLLGAVSAGGKMGRTWGSLSIAVSNPRAALPLVRAGVCWLFGSQAARAGYATISSRRLPWIRSLIRTMGFREVDRVKGGIRHGEDLVVLKLTPETCRPWQAELAKLQRMPAQEVG